MRNPLVAATDCTSHVPNGILTSQQSPGSIDVNKKPLHFKAQAQAQAIERRPEAPFLALLHQL
jgi:hypothetical protein